MHFNLTEILPQRPLLLGREILIPEEHHTPLGNQQRKLILLLVGEVLKLEPDDLRPDMPGEMDDLLRRPKEGPFLRIRAFSWVEMRPLLVADPVHVVEVEWPGGLVGIALGEVDAGFFETVSGGGGEVQVRGRLGGLDDVHDAGVDGGGGHVEYI